CRGSRPGFQSISEFISDFLTSASPARSFSDLRSLPRRRADPRLRKDLSAALAEDVAVGSLGRRPAAGYGVAGKLFETPDRASAWRARPTERVDTAAGPSRSRPMRDRCRCAFTASVPLLASPQKRI